MNLSKENVRAIIFYNFRKGLIRLRCFEELTSVFSDEAPCLRTVERWYLGFQRGHTSVSDKSREGCPKSAFTEDNIIAVRQLIFEDRHVTYREIETLLGISGTIIQKILHEALYVRKLVCRVCFLLATASAFRRSQGGPCQMV
ncbi:unnamed protein product [Euphydryas editha]|uniref:Mos1 transposase HTH domain-containing protein n=1 Tax=Euphydryas editha TaxID=104508 RepID=A0AAU9TMB7_EUPED|nr:unnamed protein product [Euphydryas editha]